MSSDEDVKQAWKRIESWHSANAAEYLGWLRPPADPAAIQRAEAELKVTFSPDWKASLLVHDGQDKSQMEFFGGWGLHSLEEAVRTWQWLQGQVKDGTISTADASEIQADPSVHPRVWDPAWIPVAPKGTGDHLLIDLNPKDPSRRGQVITYGPRTSKRAVVAPDFGAWLKQHADALEAGKWTVDEEGILRPA